MKIGSKNNKLVFVIVVVLLLIFFHWIGLLGWLENSLVRILKPSLKTTYSVSSEIENDDRADLTKEELIGLLSAKEEENSKLLSENAQLHYLQEENKILREYAGFFERTKYSHVVADVISRNTIDSSLLQSSNIIINRGSDNGITIGLLAVNQAGMAVGKVTQVSKGIAEVSLISSKRCNLAVSLQNESHTMGVTEGETGLTVSINLIPQTEEVNIDDLVVTSGLENNIPRGMIVGRVTQVEKENNEIWQRAVIEPLVDLESLMMVSIILPQSGFDF
ncbi:MAG: rod shape-determining protein MreC [bacterium]